MSGIRGRLVPIPVPPVRPLMRITIKRFLRVLPSILLLLFVISLIFVTLMQIAVIHTHRRTLAFQRGMNSGAIALATSGAANSVDSQIVTSTIASASIKTVPITPAVPAKKKTDVLRIEALLDKSLPSLETNSKILQNFINSGRIKQIIQFAQRSKILPSFNERTLNARLETFRASLFIGLNDSFINDSLFSLRLVEGHKTSNSAIESNPGLNSTSVNILLNLEQQSNSSNLTGDAIDPSLHIHNGYKEIKSLCPAVPPKLSKLIPVILMMDLVIKFCKLPKSTSPRR